jgi:rSAM/selenodomain-associated transferase 2
VVGLSILRLSIIIPVLNEADVIQKQLLELKKSLNADNEIIVVDGGSHDDTVILAENLADRVIISPQKGRAFQMNAGAALAQGDTLLFLHSDTCLPNHFTHFDFIKNEKKWGFFRVRLSGTQWQFRIIETMMNLRSQFTAIATGDQGIFIKRQFFEDLKGFAEIPLMEDVELCKRLRKYASPLIVKETVTTSSRRWEQHGIVKTILLMWRLRLDYFFGVSPSVLVKRYYS